MKRMILGSVLALSALLAGETMAMHVKGAAKKRRADFTKLAIKEKNDRDPQGRDEKHEVDGIAPFYIHRIPLGTRYRDGELTGEALLVREHPDERPIKPRIEIRKERQRKKGS